MPTTVIRLREWLGQPNLYPEKDWLLAWQGETLVGYVGLTRELEIGRLILEGTVHPHHRNQGIGRSLLNRIKSHASDLGSPLVHAPVLQRVKESGGFLKRRHFVVVHTQLRMHLEPQLTISPIKLSPLFRIRSFLPKDELLLTRIQNVYFAGSWGFKSNTVEETHYRLAMGDLGSEGVCLAVHTTEAVGYCWTRLWDYQGEIYMMGIDPKYQGQGLGRALLLQAIGALMKKGAGRMELTVDTVNKTAVALYRGVGFKAKERILWYESRLRDL